MIFIQFKHPRVEFNLLFHADLPVGIDLGQPPKNALHSWCFFYSCPAIFEVPLYLIIDRTSDCCNTTTSNTTATTTSNTTDTMAFLQYTAGAIPGKPLKRKVTTEDMPDRKKKYEKDRERKFLESWKQDRPWLHHNGENNVMVCNWCIEASGPKDLSFVKGCENFKISAIKDHEMCKFHLKIAPKHLLKNHRQYTV